MITITTATGLRHTLDAGSFRQADRHARLVRRREDRSWISSTKIIRAQKAFIWIN